MIRLKKRSSFIPSSRATAISEEVSIVNVVRPSTSAAVSPQSASACWTASTESWSSERPDSLENSVAPMPAIAALPVEPAHATTRTVPVTWSPSDTEPTTSIVAMPSSTDSTVPLKVSVS